MRTILAAGICLAPLIGTAQAQSTSCTDQGLIDDAVRLANQLNSPLFGKIELLDAPFNIRKNRYFDTNPSVANTFSDPKAQCVADVVTNRSQMVMYYGVRTINGKSYVLVKVVPNMGDEDHVATPPQPPSVENQPSEASSTWEDMLPQVKRKCASQWSNDFQMQAYCVKEQRDGWEELHQNDRPIHDVHQESAPAGVEKNYTVTRLNELAPTSTTPALTQAPAAIPIPSLAYTDGRNARIAYENWVASLNVNPDYKAGAEYWAGHRSAKPAPTTCHYTSPAFESGWEEAKRRLTTSDIRRKAEPDFKLGWNSL